jgi:hypothetical protein
VPGATGYHVKRASGGQAYKSVGCTTTPNFTDTGVVAGTAYTYVVTSTLSSGKDGGGESADSAAVTVTP